MARPVIEVVEELPGLVDGGVQVVLARGVACQQETEEVISDLDLVCQGVVDDLELGVVPGDQGPPAKLSVLQKCLDLRFQTVFELLPGLVVPDEVRLGVVLVEEVVEQGPVVGRLQVLSTHPEINAYYGHNTTQLFFAFSL